MKPSKGTKRRKERPFWKNHRICMELIANGRLQSDVDNENREWNKKFRPHKHRENQA